MEENSNKKGSDKTSAECKEKNQRINSRNRAQALSGHDGNVIADDGKPKDIQGTPWKHGGECSLPECCISSQQVFVLFNVKSADAVGMIAGRDVVIHMIASCVAHERGFAGNGST